MKYIGSRDMQASNAVAIMAQLGRFETEYLIYGSAVQEMDGKIYYYATTNQEKLYQCIMDAKKEERYFMPMVHYIKRLQVPADLENEWLVKTKIELIRLMKQQYEIFIPLMQPLFQKEPNDLAFDLLCDYQDAIDGYFDDTMLQLFDGLLEMSYQGKVLSKASYSSLKNWHDKVRHQMADDPVNVDNITRELYGFIYMNAKGVRKPIFDAQKMNVVEIQHKKITEGYLVSPIIRKQYAFKQFNEFPKIRENFIRWLMESQSEEYFHYISKIKSLEGVITNAEFEAIEKEVSIHEYAMEALTYYSAIFNKAQ